MGVVMEVVMTLIVGGVLFYLEVLCICTIAKASDDPVLTALGIHGMPRVLIRISAIFFLCFMAHTIHRAYLAGARASVSGGGAVKGGPPLAQPTTMRTDNKLAARRRWKRDLRIIGLVLRICAIINTLCAMGTTTQNLPFFTRIFGFQTSYDDFLIFTFFLMGIATICAYLVLSLPFSIACIVRPRIVGARMLLLRYDKVALVLTMEVASAAAAVVYLANNGNPNTNWPTLCQQSNEFCPRGSDAVVGSFHVAFILGALVVLSVVAL